MFLDDPELSELWGQVCVNGRLLPAGEARVSALDRGFLHGDGIFETIRVYGGKPFMLDAHLRRLADGCSAIKLSPPDLHEVANDAQHVLHANRLSDAYLRITVTRGPTGKLWYELEHAKPTVLTIAKPLVPQDLRKGLRLMVSGFRSDERNPLSGIKHTGILWKILARAEAKDAGADEAVLLDTRGHVSEATSANIFWVRDGALYTPSLDCGILRGITRGLVIEIAQGEDIAVTEGRFKLDELRAADEAFLTSSTRELAPIRSLDDVRFAEPVPGRLTKRLSEIYRSRTRG